MLAKSQFTGRLTADAEVRKVSDERVAVNFTVAASESVKRGDSWEDESSFYDCTMFVKATDKRIDYLTKGKAVQVAGKFKTQKWQVDVDGQPQTRTKLGFVIDMDGFEFAPTNKEDGATVNKPASQPAQAQAPAESPAAGGAGNPDDDEIPF